MKGLNKVAKLSVKEMSGVKLASKEMNKIRGGSSAAAAQEQMQQQSARPKE